MTRAEKVYRTLFEEPNVGPLSKEAEELLALVASVYQEFDYFFGNGTSPEQRRKKKKSVGAKTDMDKLFSVMESRRRKHDRVRHFENRLQAVFENGKFAKTLFADFVVEGSLFTSPEREQMIFDGLSADLVRLKMNPQTMRSFKLFRAIVLAIKSDIEADEAAVLKTSDPLLFDS